MRLIELTKEDFMAMSDITSTWENIRRGVKDAELLIGDKVPAGFGAHDSLSV